MKIRIYVVLIALLSPLNVNADYDFNEGRTLLLMVEELDFLISLAEEQSKRPKKSDFVFNYDALGSDLSRIRMLIRYHMESAAKKPNQIEPLQHGVDPVQGVYSKRQY